MKKFKFRLQRVLDYREIVKDEKRRELLLCNHKLAMDRERLEQLAEAERQNRLEEGVVMSAARVLQAGDFAVGLQKAMERQREIIIEDEAAVEKAMNAYIEAAKESRALSLLKERRLTEYKDYLEKEELRNLDETAVQKGNQLYQSEEGQNG